MKSKVVIQWQPFDVVTVASPALSAMSLVNCPPSLRSIAHFLRCAQEHEARDVTVAYWCRLHALQTALKIQGAKGPQETELLTGLMDWLEQAKKTQVDNEAVTNEVAAQAHLENYALKLFLYADKQDREGNYGKNVVKAFYTSGVIFDVLEAFGELTEEVSQNRKYAKWKAAYIHNCLKNGEVPVPGPMASEEDQDQPGNVPSIVEPGPSTSKSIDIPQPPSDLSFNEDPNKIHFGGPVNVLPSVPHSPDTNPGGFHAFVPPSIPNLIPSQQTSGVTLTAEQITKAQKYCKWAGSALNYDDITTAIENLKNALVLLQTGHDST